MLIRSIICWAAVLTAISANAEAQDWAELDRLRAEVRRLGADLNTLKLEVVRLRLTSSTARLHDLDAQLKRLDAERAALDEEESTARHDIAEIEGQMTSPTLTEAERFELVQTHATALSTRGAEIARRRSANAQLQKTLQQSLEAIRREVHKLETEGQRLSALQPKAD
jgi:chromosome segregation ATPase